MGEIDYAALAKLREPFTPDKVGHLPRGGTQIDYVGHGAVRERLLDVDPEWSWQPLAYDEAGRPLMEFDPNGNPVGLWIKLTVCGVTRLGFGSCTGSQFEAEKVLIGDALRNAAMSFGVALDLWIKGHAEDDERVSSQDDRQREPRGQRQQSRERVCMVCQKSLAGATNVVPGGGGFNHAECVKAADKPDEEPF